MMFRNETEEEKEEEEGGEAEGEGEGEGEDKEGEEAGKIFFLFIDLFQISFNCCLLRFL